MTGLVIAIKSLNATSIANSLVIKFIRDSARRIQKELEENGNKHDVKIVAASMKY